jgi:hypothetical protein
MHADTITAANEAHVAKEKALSEVAALKLAAEKEHAAFEEEWRQLSHIVENDRCACSVAAGEGSGNAANSIMQVMHTATVLCVL